MTSPVLRAASAALVALSSLLFAGCDADDRAGVLQTLTELDEAVDARDGSAFCALVSPETHDYYTTMIQTALTADVRQTRALNFGDKFEVLYMRARFTRADLQGLDGRGYLAMCVRKGLFDDGVREKAEYKIRAMKVEGSSATADIMYVDTPDIVETMNFVRVEDRWLCDWRRADERFERAVNRWADRLNIRREDGILRLVLFLADRYDTPDLWDAAYFK
jgi:hypothetical protein